MAATHLIPSPRTLGMMFAGSLLVGSLSIVGASAPDAQGAPELPPVTISSTTVRADETLTFSGSGCVDPETSTGDGLEVVLYIPADAGRGGTTYRPTVRAAANTDGTFEGSGVVDQPFFPDGVQTGFFSCQDVSEDPFPPVAAQRPVELVIEAPSLPDLTVLAGSTVDYELPCSIGGGEYGAFTISGSAVGAESIYLTVPGSFPYETSPQQGDQVELEVPADAVPGVFDAIASCSVSQAGTSAYFAGFTLTVMAVEQPAPPATPPAEPAQPTAAAPAYTG